MCCTCTLGHYLLYCVRMVQWGIVSASTNLHPFGHTLPERRIVELILSLDGRGHTSYAIAKQLDAWGCPPRTAVSWLPVYVTRILRREHAHSGGNPDAIRASLQAYSRCVWCGVGSELSEGKPSCIRCGHRLDVPKFRCDCSECATPEA